MSEFNRAVSAYTAVSGVSQDQPLIVSGSENSSRTVTVSQVIGAMASRSAKERARFLHLLPLTNRNPGDVLDFLSQSAELIFGNSPTDS